MLPNYTENNNTQGNSTIITECQANKKYEKSTTTFTAKYNIVVINRCHVQSHQEYKNYVSELPQYSYSYVKLKLET